MYIQSLVKICSKGDLTIYIFSQSSDKPGRGSDNWDSDNQGSTACRLEIRA